MSAPNPECPGCQALLAQVNELKAQILLLSEQVDKLSARLNQNSQNSSRPPSADPPSAPPRPPKPPPSGRPRGGQPGHKGGSRCLSPQDQVDLIVPFYPPHCENCQQSLPQERTPAAPEPRRHQVLDLPPKLVLTTEYQCYAARCPGCAHLTWASLPATVPTGLIGPRLQAVCALLVARYRLSRRCVAEWLWEVGGEMVSPSCLSALETKTAQALDGAYAEAKRAVASARVVHADETRWREGNRKAWLWLVRTTRIACFAIDPRRSRAAFEQLLPQATPGQTRTVVCDRYSAYQHLKGDERQVCWAHLLREFAALGEMAGVAKELGEAGVRLIGEFFGQWHAYRGGEIAWEEMQQQMRPVMAAMARVLRRGRESRHWRGEVLGRELLRQWACLWTFVRVEGVEPTNNLAEQAVRPGVLWRKNCFGNQSAGGRVFVERMLTVVGSLRLQGRSVLGYLEASIRAAQRGERRPSLLPVPAGEGG